MGMKKKPCHGSRFKQHHKPGSVGPEHADSVVVGPFKSYDEIKEFTDTLVHDESKQQSETKPLSWISESEYVQSTKTWANDLVQEVKDIDFKESFKNIINDNDALFAVMAGVMCGLTVFCIIYLVYLRNMVFNSDFEDYEAVPVMTSTPEYFDEKLPLYEEEESLSSDHE